MLEYLKPYGAKDRKMQEKKVEEQAELKRLREAANEGTLSLCTHSTLVYSCLHDCLDSGHNVIKLQGREAPFFIHHILCKY